MPRLASVEADYRRALPALGERRRELDLTQLDVASACELTNLHVAKLEKGQTTVDRITQAEIAKILDGAVDDFFAPLEEREWVTAAVAAEIAGVAPMTIIRPLRREIPGPACVLQAEQRQIASWRISPIELTRWADAYQTWRDGKALLTLTCACEGCGNTLERRQISRARGGFDYCSTECAEVDRARWTPQWQRAVNAANGIWTRRSRDSIWTAHP
jgi:transcriptional regulator with XRE-family HTH domain